MAELSYATVRSDRTAAEGANVFDFGVRAEEQLLAPERLKRLSATFEKFQRSHAERLQTTGAQLPARGQLLLDALPSLLHGNIASISSRSTNTLISGIVHHEPDQKALRALATLSHRVPTKAELAVHRCEIQAVFLMGSAGSTAQTRDSDIDIWVCAPPSAHPRLAPKLRNIERLAEDLGVVRC